MPEGETFTIPIYRGGAMSSVSYETYESVAALKSAIRRSGCSNFEFSGDDGLDGRTTVRSGLVEELTDEDLRDCVRRHCQLSLYNSCSGR
jgi:hypothetical protein